MSERDALLAAIRATPDDDLPRLVLADWLDEQSGGYSPRAEFIRNDCERGMWFRFPPGRAPAITFHEKEPPQTRRVGIDVPTDDGICYDTHRGFVSVVELPFESWIRYADRILPESVGLYLKLTTTPEIRMVYAPSDPSVYVGIRFTGDTCPLIPRQVVDEIAACVDASSARGQTAARLIRWRWPEVAAVELPPATDWNANTTDVVGQLRTAREEILRQIIRSFAVPEHIIRGEPEPLTEVRRQLRLARDTQRQYAYWYGTTRFIRSGTGESVTYVPDNEYMQLEAYARELENEIVRNTGRRDF